MRKKFLVETKTLLKTEIKLAVWYVKKQSLLMSFCIFGFSKEIDKLCQIDIP
jgi:hypothetical protein